MLKAALIQKIVVGVLGASLASSGLAYAGVPGAPNPVKAVVDVVSDGDEGENGDEVASEETGLPEEAVQGQLTAEEKQAAAEDYTEAIREWADCVNEAAEAQSDEETRTEGEFDPRAECDERPQPGDFGLTEVPEQAADEAEAADQAEQRAEEGRQDGDDARTENQPDDTDGTNQDGSEQRAEDGASQDGSSQDGSSQEQPSGQDYAPNGRP